MDIKQLIYALEVSKLRSFSAAARELFVSQPRLSQAIIDLEREIGFEIFVRDSRGIAAVTLRGEAFLNRAETVTTGFSELTKDYKEPLYSFRLASTPNERIKRAFLRFCTECEVQPHFRVLMTTPPVFEIIENVRVRGFDIGLIYLMDAQSAEWLNYFALNGISYTFLKELAVYAIVSERDPLAERDCVSMDDLREYTYVHLSAPPSHRLSHMPLDQALGALDANREIEVYDRDLSYRCVAATRSFLLEADSGQGDSHLAAYGLKALRLEDGPACRLGYIRLQDRPMGANTKQFLKILGEFI